ncbi:hypothetical protein ElyMa_001324500 [Elysia marginata]|uniref:Uncharacterized protein n=1 Tax=Elysia marginata TaxID=1093978 RepID=A0AAV4INE4_9GAST|nr:hypothetical protein ElyMa_001324500 [Elysia marginata]
MEYCLPHAVLALLQEEDSPQTPKSYFVRSGTHSTKITLVYTRRKRRDKSSNPPSLTCFSSFSSPSSLSTNTDKPVSGKASSTDASPGLLRLQNSSASHKLQQIHRSSSVTEGCQVGVSRFQFKSSSYHSDKRSSAGLSHGGKMARSSFIASRSQGSSGTSNGMTSSSSTDDYSNADNHNHHRQVQKDTTAENVSPIHNERNDQKQNLGHGQHSFSNPSNRNKGQGQPIQVKGNVVNDESEVKGQYRNYSKSPVPQWKNSAVENDSYLTNSFCGSRRTRSDSHNSRRTCVSTPGRGYGDSARVRGAEDPRTRGFSRAIAKTDPRRNSVSPRGGMDACDNFRIFEHSIDDHNEHLTISHNSTPRSDRSSYDHQHRPPQQQHEEEHSQGQPCYHSSKTSQTKTIKHNEFASPQRLSVNGSPRASRSPRPKCSKDQPVFQVAALIDMDAHTEKENENHAGYTESVCSPRPPTPHVPQGGSFPAIPPTPCFSPNDRHSPAPCHSPSRQSTFEYDGDEGHLSGHFSPPPTPCLRSSGATDDAVESFNSSVKLRLGAQIDQMTSRLSRASTPKYWRSNVTPPPSTIGLNPPTPGPHATETHHSPGGGAGVSHYWRSSK